jgi:hypothetical protein
MRRNKKESTKQVVSEATGVKMRSHTECVGRRGYAARRNRLKSVARQMGVPFK